MLEVKPVAHELTACCPLALRDLIFMMRKHEIDSAQMQIESLAEVLHRHRRTFDMPTGTAAADACFPGGFVLFRGGFPEGEVPRIFLIVFVSIDALAPARDVAREINFRKLAVIRERTDAIVNRAIRSIGMVILLQLIDQIGHF